MDELTFEHTNMLRMLNAIARRTRAMAGAPRETAGGAPFRRPWTSPPCSQGSLAEALLAARHGEAMEREAERAEGR